MRDELDNPVWAALRTRHRGTASSAEGWARYPIDCAPFLGVADADVDVRPALAPGETVYLLGVLPAVPADWVLKTFHPLAQMECDQPIEVIDGPPIEALLSASDQSDVLALTALVYPHYFRNRTMELGRYFGIHQDGRLAAMIGERLGTDHAREMSAICTHPDFLGRGYARRLTAWLSNETLGRGLRPFLHVSYENPRALSMYRQLGYRVRIDIPFWSLTRPAAS